MTQQLITPKKHTRIFLLIFIGCISFSLVATYYKYVILEDYEVFVEYDDQGELLLIE